MIVSADWAIPVSSPPIRRGAVLVRKHEIREVGTAEQLAAANPGEERQHFDGCVLVPGLVNAHTHLSLTVLGGLLPRSSMPEWLPRVVRARRALSDDDLAASAALGAQECLRSGVTVVGDIAYGPEATSAAADAGLGGAFFWEVLGIPESQLAEELARIEYPSEPGACGGRMRCGLSPHSAYTSGPGLIRATAQAARAVDALWTIHLAESTAESRLLAYGDGPLAGSAERLAFGFRPPRKTAAAYLDRLGALDGAIAVHCTQATAKDATLLAKRARGVVLCPRSNAYLNNGAPPVGFFVASGVPLGLGTDSSASNDDLDLLEEARALRRVDPALRADRVLRIVTLEGARVLGLEGHFGSLEKDKEADLALFEVEGTDPVEALLQHGGRKTARAVMTSGVWRVLDGDPVFASVRVPNGDEGRAKAEAALAG